MENDTLEILTSPNADISDRSNFCQRNFVTSRPCGCNCLVCKAFCRISCVKVLFLRCKLTCSCRWMELKLVWTSTLAKAKYAHEVDYMLGPLIVIVRTLCKTYWKVVKAFKLLCNWSIFGLLNYSLGWKQSGRTNLLVFTSFMSMCTASVVTSLIHSPFHSGPSYLEGEKLGKQEFFQHKAGKILL